ncbi:crotonase/enoyl-CoA hydratase family protein [Tomitella fengzijianii]|uniref:Crotonase/enoyl-CoA hydratase family protein n=1 Tax=Tomitella fengzijianii TaxID=2597660 RepID=A0A516X2I5_9ACTN|nr:crotonase/enoyl-CoA hydratase family protein [Tomitella fengzijianii]QDQ96821.1 crotonase/enoyl-CoA hydratase family protein [Tomitella fengzijianii]
MTATTTRLDISSEHCLVDKRGHTLIVTMHRPEARNALSADMMATMQAAWDLVDEDPDIRVAILTGAGGAFCAGMDLKSMNSAPPGESMRSGDESGQGGGGSSAGGLDVTRLPALLKGRRLTKPLIAAVEGAAVAGGTEILQGTDIRVAGRSARFGVAEAKWGLFPLGGSAVRLARQIPYTLAADMLLTGRLIGADEAREYGLIGHVVDEGAALDKALELAETIAGNGPVAVQAILRTLRETEGMHEEDAFRIESKIGVEVFRSDDAKIGPRAFAQKQKPEFTGR